MNAICSTFLIFIWSLTILVCIGLLSFFNYNKFIGFWFLSPYDYPFSFAIALFISLTFSAIGNWIFNQQRQDFNLIIVILCIFLGCLLRLSVPPSLEVNIINIFSMMIILPVAIMSMGKIAIPIAYLIALVVGGIRLIVGGIGFYIPPLILVFFACKFPNKKTSNQAKRFRYASPALGTIMLIYFYTFGTSFYVTPGLIIPNNLRHIWGGIQYPQSYEQAIAKVKSCPLITDTLGEIEATALAEGNNSPSMDLDGDDWQYLSVEVVGKRGTVIIKDCATDACPKNIYADTTKLNQDLSGKQIYYAQCEA